MQFVTEKQLKKVLTTLESFGFVHGEPYIADYFGIPAPTNGDAKFYFVDIQRKDGKTFSKGHNVGLLLNNQRRFTSWPTMLADELNYSNIDFTAD